METCEITSSGRNLGVFLLRMVLFGMLTCMSRIRPSYRNIKKNITKQNKQTTNQPNKQANKQTHKQTNKTKQQNKQITTTTKQNKTRQNNY